MENQFGPMPSAVEDDQANNMRMLKRPANYNDDRLARMAEAARHVGAAARHAKALMKEFNKKGDDFKKVSVRAKEMSRSDEDAGDRRESGTVEEYDALKGVGYIKPDRDGGFLGWSRIAFCRPAGLMPSVCVGDKVTYEKAMMFGGGLEALRLQLWPDTFMPARDAKKPDPSKEQPDPSGGTSSSAFRLSSSGFPSCFAPKEAELEQFDEGGPGVSTPNQKKRRSRTLAAKQGSLATKPGSALKRPAAAMAPPAKAGPTDAPDGDAASKVWVSKGKDICKVEAVFGEGDGKTPSGAVKRKHVKTYIKKRDGVGFHQKGDALKKSILENRMTLRQIRGMLTDID